MQPPRPDQPQPQRQPFPLEAVVKLVVLGVAAWFIFTQCNFTGGGDEGPKPGSMGAQMCDVHRDRTNPDHVKYDGVWYSSECLLNYP